MKMYKVITVAESWVDYFNRWISDSPFVRLAYIYIIIIEIMIIYAVRDNNVEKGKMGITEGFQYEVYINGNNIFHVKDYVSGDELFNEANFADALQRIMSEERGGVIYLRSKGLYDF